MVSRIGLLAWDLGVYSFYPLTGPREPEQESPVPLRTDDPPDPRARPEPGPSPQRPPSRADRAQADLKGDKVLRRHDVEEDRRSER